MSELSEKTCRRIFEICAKRSAEMNFFEYPFFNFDVKTATAVEIFSRLAKNFQSPGFLMGLYIHVPFCQSRCLFCRYYSEEVKPEDDIINEYLDALERQLEIYASRIDFSRVNLRNLYLGGGTPTFLDEEQLSRLFGIIRRHFNFDSKKIQVSCEATPQSITESKIRHLRSLGVNRVSLGIQSFNDRILESVERKHSAKDILRAFKILRKAGIRYLSTDFLVGLPGETLGTYRRTIKALLELEPEFIEGFLFTPDQKFAKIARTGIIKRSLDEIMAMFIKELSSKYRIYFKANSLALVRKGISVRRANNGNLEWMIGLGRPCLSLGPNGINVFPNVKFVTACNVKDYIDYFKNGNRKKIFRVHYLAEDDRKRHFIITHIAVSRWFYKKTYFKLFESSLEKDFPRQVDYLKRAGILRETPQKFIWRFNEKEMGHRNYFIHVLKYWYHPRYIRRFLNKIGRNSQKKNA